MSKKYDELRSSIRIDKHSLDEELVQFPSVMLEVNEQVAAAIADRDAKKSLLNESEAQALARVRKDAADKGEKITEGAVKERAAMDSLVMKDSDIFQAAEESVRMWQALQNALDAKGKMLRELGSLFVAGYWSVSSAGGSATSAKVKEKEVSEVRAEQKEARARRVRSSGDNNG